MAGRPRREVTEAQRAEIVRQATHLSRGLWRIRRATGLTERQVRAVMDAEGLRRPPVQSRRWDNDAPEGLRPDEHVGPYTHDDHIRRFIGERTLRHLARDLGRSVDAVRVRMAVLGLRLGDKVGDLTLAQAAGLVGRDVVTLLAAVRRKELAARHVDDAVWRVWPTDLRAWVLEDIARVRVRQSIDVHALLGLLLGQWGVSLDTARKRAARQRQRGET